MMQTYERTFAAMIAALVGLARPQERQKEEKDERGK